MSADGATELPPYFVPGKGDGVKEHHVQTRFSGGNMRENELRPNQAHSATPVSTQGGGVPATTADVKRDYRSYDMELGREAGTILCGQCQKEVTTKVDHKVGIFTCLMCLLFICSGVLLPVFFIACFIPYFKDVVHTCPECKKVLHTTKKI